MQRNKKSAQDNYRENLARLKVFTTPFFLFRIFNIPVQYFFCTGAWIQI